MAKKTKKTKKSLKNNGVGVLTRKEVNLTNKEEKEDLMRRKADKKIVN